jgi:transketolase
MLLYSLLYLTGTRTSTIERDQEFPPARLRRPPGHPEYGHAAGIETTTGPLGQGLANSVGMALCRTQAATHEFGADLVEHFTYVLAGDGCLMEGISQEALALAGHLKLNKLIVFWDDNNISIDGAISLPTRPTSMPASNACQLEHDRASTATIRTRSPPPSRKPRSPTSRR